MQNNFFPITFSIPESKIISIESFKNINKKKLLSNLIPGRTETYIYNTEDAYYNEYRESIFAVTTKKGGWDCMRHYEIIANGCIPYFPNIENCPENTMVLFPKKIIIESNKLFEKITNNKIITDDDINNSKRIIIELLQFMKENLTCRKIAEYILKKTNNNSDIKRLYLSGHMDPDYLRCLTLIGFKEIMGKNCHDYPKVSHLYKNQNIDYSKLYGRGFSYSNILENYLHEDALDESIEKDIIDKKYDIVIFGSYHRGIPYYDLVSSIYDSNKIILLCGEENHNCEYHKFSNNGNFVFVREPTK